MQPLLLHTLFALLIVSSLTRARTPVPASQPARLEKGDQTRSLELGGLTRTYFVHVPPHYDASKPTPLVLVFHGALMNGPLMAAFTGMNAKSDAANFVAVYPNGTGFQQQRMLFFNAWARPGANGKPPDDVKFTSRMIDDLATAMNLDRHRVYACGLSNGGMMSYRLAAELSDRIAAIASVGGTMAMPPDPRPTRPVPVLHFHGTADTIVPWNGQDRSKFQWVKFESVDDSIQTWVKLDGCPRMPTVTDLPDIAHDGTAVQRIAYGPGKAGSGVVLYKIAGGGHTWPGRPAPVAFIGAATRQINANDIIWEFFQKHPMK